MYLRRCRATNRKNAHVYWELVESYRTERGPRQRVVAYLGELKPSQRNGVQLGRNPVADVLTPSQRLSDLG